MARFYLSPTPSNTPSNTPAITPSNTSCPITPSLSSTPTRTPNSTSTPTMTQTNTPTLTQTPTSTLITSPTPTVTSTPTLTPTPTTTQLWYSGVFCTGNTQYDSCICTGSTTLYSSQPFYTPSQQVYTQQTLDPAYWAPIGLFMASGGTSYEYQFTGFLPELVEIGACPTLTPTPTITQTNTPTLTSTPTPTPSLPAEYALLTEGDDFITTEAGNVLEYEH